MSLRAHRAVELSTFKVISQHGILKNGMPAEVKSPHSTVAQTYENNYNHTGFEVLGFPCNLFGKQEPGGNGEEILNGIRHVRPGNGFLPNFPVFKKIDVNGANEHPLYTFLKQYCPPTRDEFVDQAKLFYTPLRNRDIRWNFEKILVDRTGMPVMRYDPSTKPEDIAKDIEYLMAQST
ncbi:glutathione peroxidase 6 [Trichonephila clavipes]|nr:glutathione peroxidase 6 [Trichonephila clavipes]